MLRMICGHQYILSVSIGGRLHVTDFQDLAALRSIKLRIGDKSFDNPIIFLCSGFIPPTHGVGSLLFSASQPKISSLPLRVRARN